MWDDEEEVKESESGYEPDPDEERYYADLESQRIEPSGGLLPHGHSNSQYR
jgi:hypothetical protein